MKNILFLKNQTQQNYCGLHFAGTRPILLKKPSSTFCNIAAGTACTSLVKKIHKCISRGTGVVKAHRQIFKSASFQLIPHYAYGVKCRMYQCTNYL